MNKRIWLVIITSILTSTTAIALSRAEVRGIIEAAYPGAVISEIDKEKHEGKRVYEVDFKHEGRALEAIISKDGQIIQVEIDD